MEENQLYSFQSEVRSLAYAPGNMTRYELVAVRLNPPGGARWVVSCTNMGGCMTVHDGIGVHESYIAEKMPRRIGKWTDSDLTALREGIEKLLK